MSTLLRVIDNNKKETSLVKVKGYVSYKERIANFIKT